MAYLDDLPAELIENVVICLTLNEICALRLANRSLASKASQDHFRAFYRSKRIDIDERGLKDFVVCTANAGMGCLVDDFTLTGLVYNTIFIKNQLRPGDVRIKSQISEGGATSIQTSIGWRPFEEAEREALRRQLNILQRRQKAQLHFLQSEDAQRLLRKAFRNIKRGRTSSTPLSLTLNLAVYRDDALCRSAPADGGSWRLIWQSAADTFQLVQDALDASTLAVSYFRCFPTHGKNSQMRSSLACNEIGPVIAYSGLESCLASLKALTLAFSDTSLRYDDKDAELLEAGDRQEQSRQPIAGRELQLIVQAANSANFTGLLSFVKACRNIRELDLHRYQLTNHGDTSRVQGDKVSNMLFQHLKLTELRDCRLRGFRAGSDDIIHFLQNHQTLQKLLLKNFTLSSGTFRPVFDHCTGNPDTKSESMQPKLDSIELEDLFEDATASSSKQLLLFTGPKLEDDSKVSGWRSTNNLSRWASGTKRLITYQRQNYNIGRGSQWQKQAMEEFGPPDQRYIKFL